MKMSKEHYNVIKERVATLVPQIPAHTERLRADPRVKNLPLRLLWDVFHAARIYELYSYQQFDYKDTHIETAMRAIFKELKVDVPAHGSPVASEGLGFGS